MPLTPAELQRRLRADRQRLQLRRATLELRAPARIIHEARRENAESAGDSRPSDRRPPETYGKVVEDGRREEVAKIQCFRRSQQGAQE